MPCFIKARIHHSKLLKCITPPLQRNDISLQGVATITSCQWKLSTPNLQDQNTNEVTYMKNFILYIIKSRLHRKNTLTTEDIMKNWSNSTEPKVFFYHIMSNYFAQVDVWGCYKYPNIMGGQKRIKHWIGSLKLIQHDSSNAVENLFV